MRLLVLRGISLACGLLLLAATPVPRKKAATKKTTATTPSAGKKEEVPGGAESAAVPDIGRYFDTWLWVKSEGIVATSTPETRGAARTLILNPDLSYEFHQRRDTRDSILCRGRFGFSEETAPGKGSVPVDYLDFEGWFESYEHRMSADFVGPDTLLLAGDGCENCPEHTFVRGRTASFEGSVRQGESYRHDLWDGLRFELQPGDLGWRIAIRDTTRKDQPLTALTPPLHGPNDCDIEGWHFRNQANTGPNQGDVNAPQRSREFIFSRELGKSIPFPVSSMDVTVEQVDRVAQQGRGALDIEDLVLTPPKPGQQAGIQSMRFKVAIEEVRSRAPSPSRRP